MKTKAFPGAWITVHIVDNYLWVWNSSFYEYKVVVLDGVCREELHTFLGLYVRPKLESVVVILFLALYCKP